MERSGEKLGLKSKHSLQVNVVERDLRVVIDVGQDEITVKFSYFKREFIFAHQSITVLGFEIQNPILSM